jgi:uncharacterized lipoprotein YbaY
MKRCSCLAIASLALAACSDSMGPESAVGRYELVSIDGEPLPYVLSEVFDDKIEITAGHMQLNADLTCSGSLTIENTTEGQVTPNTQTNTCTWTLTGTAIDFEYPDAPPLPGSLFDRTLTVVSQGLVLVFEG